MGDFWLLFVVIGAAIIAGVVLDRMFDRCRRRRGHGRFIGPSQIKDRPPPPPPVRRRAP